MLGTLLSVLDLLAYLEFILMSCKEKTSILNESSTCKLKLKKMMAGTMQTGKSTEMEKSLGEW